MKSNGLRLTQTPAKADNEGDKIGSPSCAINEHLGLCNFISELVYAFAALAWP
jgi:hypothetical protein